MNVLNHTSISKILSEELARRKYLNHSYSLRAFAKSLKVSPGELSEAIRGIRPITINFVNKLEKIFNFNEDEKEHLKSLVLIDQGKLSREDYFLEKKSLSKLTISQSTFKLISKWYHFAILNLFDCYGFVWCDKYISKRLGIKKSKAKEAMQNLIRIGLVVKRGKKYQTVDKNIFAGDQGFGLAVRTYHQEMLLKAIESIEKDSVEERYSSGIGVPIKKEDLKKLEKEIIKFENRILKKYSSTNADEVYQLQNTFFPITKQ